MCQGRWPGRPVTDRAVGGEGLAWPAPPSRGSGGTWTPTLWPAGMQPQLGLRTPAGAEQLVGAASGLLPGRALSSTHCGWWGAWEQELTQGTRGRKP